VDETGRRAELKDAAIPEVTEWSRRIEQALSQNDDLTQLLNRMVLARSVIKLAKRLNLVYKIQTLSHQRLYLDEKFALDIYAIDSNRVAVFDAHIRNNALQPIPSVTKAMATMSVANRPHVLATSNNVLILEHAYLVPALDVLVPWWLIAIGLKQVTAPKGCVVDSEKVALVFRHPDGIDIVLRFNSQSMEWDAGFSGSFYFVVVLRIGKFIDAHRKTAMTSWIRHGLKTARHPANVFNSILSWVEVPVHVMNDVLALASATMRTFTLHLEHRDQPAIQVTPVNITFTISFAGHVATLRYDFEKKFLRVVEGPSQWKSLLSGSGYAAQAGAPQEKSYLAATLLRALELIPKS
jgi:hypothetical protein